MYPSCWVYFSGFAPCLNASNPKSDPLLSHVFHWPTQSGWISQHVPAKSALWTEENKRFLACMFVCVSAREYVVLVVCVDPFLLDLQTVT